MTEEVPPLQLDSQDPLPESNWLWRRVFTFMIAIACLGFIWYGVEALWDMHDNDAIYRVTRYMIGILFFTILCYMVAPSAEQIVLMIQAAKNIRAKTPQARNIKVTERGGRKTETRVVSGDPVPDPIPAAPASPVVVEVPVEAPPPPVPTGIDAAPEKAPW